MKPITRRNLPPEVARTIRQTAQEQNLSANRAVIRLLEEKTGAGRPKMRTVHHDLDALAGSWSTSEARAFDRALARQRVIDQDLWK
jgi:hypothetical protein